MNMSIEYVYIPSNTTSLRKLRTKIISVIVVFKEIGFTNGCFFPFCLIIDD